MVDLFGFLRAEPVDMRKVEAEVREIERFKADGIIARIHTNEAAKAQLTTEQREKLKTLRAGGRGVMRQVFVPSVTRS